MVDSLRQRVRQTDFEDPEQEAFLNLLVAAGHMRQRLHEVCAGYGITHDQYNVLRILKGVHPEGHPRYEIAERLIERAPDVTRLLDRLVRDGLVERYRCAEDRRLSLARITPSGLDLLDAMDTDVCAVRQAFIGPLPEHDQVALSRICTAIYAGAS